MRFDEDTTTLPAEGATTTETTSCDRDEVTPEQFHAANLADALTFLLLELRAPIAVRSLLTALQGLLSGRSKRVTFKRRELAKRLFAESNDWLSESAMERLNSRVTDALSLLRDWIHRESLSELVLYLPGTKTTDNAIETRLFKWSHEVASVAGKRLTPDSPDSERRNVFIHEARQILNKRRFGTRRQKAGERIKRAPSKSANWKTVLTLATSVYVENVSVSARPSNDAIDFLCNDLRRHLENIPPVKPREEKGHWGDYGTTLITCSPVNSETDYSNEASPFDMEVPFDLMEVTR
jgi:hypothetical protein